ncbi:branched-chain amino acid ABC transporter permease [Alphaproteobacteria bacterium]|nr:branched-chain amino acid ABC transporter permease [Alphaproteobacteria bacterium]
MLNILKPFSTWIIIAAIAAGLPLIFESSFALTLLSKMGVLIIFTVAYNMLLGQGGMLSFGHAIYFGLAGYASIHILNGIGEETLPYFPTVLFPFIGAIVGLFFGSIVGYVSTRRAGTAFAMISLGFCEMVTAMTLIFVIFFNGEDGIQTDRMVGPEPFGVSFGPQIEVYYLILFWVLVTVALMYIITKTPFGRMSNAVRDNPERAAFIGYSVRRVRWQAFALSSMFAGAAGSLHALNFEHIGFESVSVVQSGAVLFMAFIGGAGHFLGPIIGAIGLTYLDSTLADITEAWLLYLGLTFSAIVMFAPGGLAGLIVMHGPIARTNKSLLTSLIKPYLFAIGSIITVLIGLIGIIEMLYFRSLISKGEGEVIIFWTEFNANGMMSWLLFVILILLGIFLSKRTFPMAKESWDNAISVVKTEISK